MTLRKTLFAFALTGLAGSVLAEPQAASSATPATSSAASTAPAKVAAPAKHKHMARLHKTAAKPHDKNGAMSVPGKS